MACPDAASALVQLGAADSSVWSGRAADDAGLARSLPRRRAGTVAWLGGEVVQRAAICIQNPARTETLCPVTLMFRTSTAG